MIEAVIFDLDNCLSAADEVGTELLEPTFAAIRRANKGTLSDEALDQAFADCWRHPLDFVAKEYGFWESVGDEDGSNLKGRRTSRQQRDTLHPSFG